MTESTQKSLQPGTATADFEALVHALRKIRSMLDMDVVFVSEFLGGSRILRYVDAASGAAELKIGDSDPLDDSYCQRVIDGRLPGVICDAMSLPAARAIPATDALGVRAHLSVPIVLRDGRIFGTLCCFSRAPRPELNDGDASALRAIADFIALGIDKNGHFRTPGWVT